MAHMENHGKLGPPIDALDLGTLPTNMAMGNPIFFTGISSINNVLSQLGVSENGLNPQMTILIGDMMIKR